MRWSPFGNLKMRATSFCFILRKSACRRGRLVQFSVDKHMFIRFIGKRFDRESCSSKRSKGLFSGRLPCWVLGIGSRHWFFQISHQFNQSKKVLSTPLNSEWMHPNILIQSSSKNMFFKEINDQRVCCFLRGLIKFKDTALKPFFVQM